MYALREHIMPLAEEFQQILDSLPSDWTDVELDLRVDEDRYVDAATLLVTCNAQPYSMHDWHFRLLVAHRFGHAASAPTVHGTLKLLDDAEIEGELVLREMRVGRAEVVQMWGRPESVREEFRKLRAQ
jgi:hypothetical protein